MLEYRGYLADVRKDAATGRFVGTLEGVPDHVTFNARSMDDLKREMADAVDDYIEFCLEWGRGVHACYANELTVRLI